MTNTALTLDQALQQAANQLSVGRLSDAEMIYRTILQTQPSHPDANYNLGVLAVSIGQPVAALPFFKTALEANPAESQYWESMLDALIRSGHSDAARQLIETARQFGLDGASIQQLEDCLDAAAHTPKSPGSLPAAHEIAIAHREAGRYTDAIACLQEWLGQQPQDANAHALLAHVLLLDNQTDAAAVSLDRALALAPTLPGVQRNLARLLLKRQQVEVALQTAQAAQQIDPTHPEGWLVLAAALSANKRDIEALPWVERALQAYPDYAEAYASRALIKLRDNNPAAALVDAEKALALKPHLTQILALTASLHYQTKNISGAIIALQKALELEPANTGFMANLGELLRQDKQLDAALALLEKTIAADPGNYAACVNYGTALQEAERIDEAKAAYQKALAINPKSAEIANNLGTLAKDDENWIEAAKFFGMAANIQPNSAAIQCNLGIALKELNEIPEALNRLQLSVQLDPNYAPAYVGLARLEIDQGDFSAAAVQIDKALRLAPDSVDAWVLIPLLRKMTLADSYWLTGAERMLAAEQSSNTQARLLYAMGKYADDTKDYAAAFMYYQRANGLKKQFDPAYDRQNQVRVIDILSTTHTPQVINRIWPGASNSQRPLFIVGMPRSGTSLLEQILASHPQVFGAGELHFWEDAMKRFAQESYSAQYHADMLLGTASACLANLAKHSSEAQRVVDKMPGNFLYLGFIHACFPNACILHATRDPVDTCLSIYFQDFRRTHHYANDLDDLAHYYREYRRLMDHWREVLPATVFMDVPYEAVVGDLAGWSRRIFDFIGLEWDERCLNFHQTRRQVGTSSNWQVRQPLYKTSCERWRNYAAWIEPLLKLGSDMKTNHC